ncbi:vWA domain-containing protein [Cupriavidus oxalaticus]|uniref:VWA domain-containing protein n=1 Tax=Cupriavidus oxalaticus TaxID=96344 RepID=A0A375G9V6_9BURK|nr:VWA domain-containing protein [Cupriavidus oxalaticus]QEZ48570.1 VWA domain-containing protein [Cupriavidus oxalaticus]QRQ87877.1 VWA domain-containing protein [Cupriavidus oxalaticus]QRQ93796.1 VWA domain-containing protein [Cupriavidus oxalaticus]WQD82424.1 VWA domain-containing protein [Cupriavidus oxalaticus]SPC14888.1 von Willebrand factor, type A [Cupriavidus oxalaticus]
MYQFEYPWLFVLLPLPLLLWWLLPPYREESPSVRLPFFGEVASAAGLKPAPGAVVPRRNWLQRILAPLAWALLVTALARPQFLEAPLEKVQPARDLLLALDLSQSMDTQDFRDPAGALVPRVQAVREVVSRFVTRRPGDRIGLIVFGDAPYPLAPFTLDHVLVQAMIHDLLPGMAGPSTALGDAIGLGIKMFDRSQAPEKVLIVLTDGNDTASKMPPERAADIAKQRHVIVHTIGIGDPAAEGEQRVDLGVLQRIAAQTGGRYFFGADQAGLESIYATLDRITPHNHKTLSWRPRRELFMWPLGAAVSVVLVYQLIMAVWSAWLSRPRRHGAPQPAAEEP